MGKMAFKVLKKEREKTVKNLSLIYSDLKTSREIKDMARQVFVHQALNFADYVHTLHYTTIGRFRDIIEIEGEEHLKNAYKQQKGVICLMSHLGSWEFSVIIPPLMGYETSAVARPMPNLKIDKLIVNARVKRGMKNIARVKVYDRLVEVLKKGECLIIMIDQDIITVKGVFTDFLGKQAYTPVGAARLALDTNAAVIPMYTKRLPDNRHRFVILPPLPLINTGNKESDLYENTSIYNVAIGNIIKETPEQWVWMHERWKTTPADVEKLLETKRMR